MKKLIQISLLLNLFLGLFCSQLSAKAYFDQKTILPNLIDRPLKVGSEEWLDDVKTIINLQKNYDSKDIDQALNEINLKPEMMVEFVDLKLTRVGYPHLYKLMDNLVDTSSSISNNAKDYWHTKRPYLMDKRIKALIPAHHNPSYPSGHTTQSYVLANILGMLIPENMQKFQDRASIIAGHRILVGMHYPHDIKGGRQLSFLIVGGLLENSEFRKDFEMAKKELGSR
jgi:acid phosphatase (class A)